MVKDLADDAFQPLERMLFMQNFVYYDNVDKSPVLFDRVA